MFVKKTRVLYDSHKIFREILLTEKLCHITSLSKNRFSQHSTIYIDLLIVSGILLALE
jgi:hypothetical protein